MSVARPLVISAAGCAGLLPPNTLAGVEGGVRLGADIVEIDVALTKDGQLVARHHLRLNPSFDRDAHGRWVQPPNVPIRDLTFAELQNFDIGRPRPGSHYPLIFPDMRPLDGARIPLVEDVIATMAGLGANTTLELELKSEPGDDRASPDAAVFIPAVAAFYRKHKNDRSIVASSFDWGLLERLRGEVDDMPLYYLVPEGVHERESGIEAVISRAKRGGSAAIGLHAFDASADLIARIHETQTQVLLWGLIDPFDVREHIATGADMIVSVRPDILIPQLPASR